MNTKAEINNKGIKFAISNFKLENGLYLNPDLRREWTIARDMIGITERINPIVSKSYPDTYEREILRHYRFMFESITMMHAADVYDALYVASERFHKQLAKRAAKRNQKNIKAGN